MTGRSQNEAVTILRNTPTGGTVDLVVSRQEIVAASPPEEPTSAPPNLPRQIVSMTQFKCIRSYFIIFMLVPEWLLFSSNPSVEAT